MRGVKYMAPLPAISHRNEQAGRGFLHLKSDERRTGECRIGSPDAGGQIKDRSHDSQDEKTHQKP